jgi:hypothetical protein
MLLALGRECGNLITKKMQACFLDASVIAPVNFCRIGIYFPCFGYDA